MDEFGRTAQEFCDENAAKVSLIVAFLANAKSVRTSYNKSYTTASVGLRLDKRVVRASVGIPDLSQYDADSHLIESLFKKFGLGSQWRIWSASRNRYYNPVYGELREELVRRGGRAGFDKVFAQVAGLRKSGVAKKKMEAHKIQGDLNRALAAMKIARKSGATFRQLNKLVRMIAVEEFVEEVQGS